MPNKSHHKNPEKISKKHKKHIEKRRAKQNGKILVKNKYGHYDKVDPEKDKKVPKYRG